MVEQPPKKDIKEIANYAFGEAVRDAARKGETVDKVSFNTLKLGSLNVGFVYDETIPFHGFYLAQDWTSPGAKPLFYSLSLSYVKVDPDEHNVKKIISVSENGFERDFSESAGFLIWQNRIGKENESGAPTARVLDEKEYLEAALRNVRENADMPESELLADLKRQGDATSYVFEAVGGIDHDEDFEDWVYEYKESPQYEEDIRKM